MDWFALVRPVLFGFDSEDIHHWTLEVLEDETVVGALGAWMGAAPGRAVEAAGLRFRNRVGLAAGFDKNGVALAAWRAMGFGSVEVGTVTPDAQPGNPRPRIHRFPREEALVNAMGFPNDGAAAVAERVAAFQDRDGFPVGINLGKGKATSLEAAPADYLAGLRMCYEAGDYFVVNVSSPNTPGLRALQTAEDMARLLGPMMEWRAGRPGRVKPIFVKLAPDLDGGAARALAEAAVRHGADGLIATNTTLDHSALRLERSLRGGLSGRPLRDRSQRVLEEVVAAVRDAVPVIGCGGLSERADAEARVGAGATLLQVYSAFVFRGPAVIGALA